MKKIIVIAVLAVSLAAAGLSGCATGAKSEAMVSEKTAVGRTLGNSVSVAVSGGKQTSGVGASQISDDAFRQALQDSIVKSALFKEVSPSGQYTLNAFIGKVDQPMMGFSLTVKMEVSYTLVDAASGKTVWSKNIASEYTAKTGEAFAAVKRLRLANEGAARNNISQAISEMSALQL